MKGAQRGYPWSSPCSSLALSSGALSLKGAVWRGNPSLISEQYKFFSPETVASLSVICLILLSKYQGNHSVFWTSESLAHLISNSDEECQFALLQIFLPCLQLDLHVLYFVLSVHALYRKHLWLPYLQRFSTLQVSFATLAAVTECTSWAKALGWML